MRSKISLHLNNAVNGINIWPAVVTLLDPSAEWVREVHNLSPKTLIIARHNFEPNQPLTDPEQNARDAYAILRPRALATKGIAHWQLYNETATDSVDGMARLNRFSLTAMSLAEADGVKLAILAASTGTPKRPDEDIAHWTAFLPSVRRAISGGHILLLHEYGPRSVMQMQGLHVGRHREAMMHLPELAQAKTVITETGIDGGSHPYNLPRPVAGWRNVSGLTAAAYMAQLAEADALYSDFRNVLGLCIYCAGGQGSGWRSFSIDPELMPLLDTYWRTNPPLYPTEPLIPPPVTTPPPQKPPIQEPPVTTPGFNPNPYKLDIYQNPDTGEWGAIGAMLVQFKDIATTDEIRIKGAYSQIVWTMGASGRLYLAWQNTKEPGEPWRSTWINNGMYTAALLAAT
jgi:hypothetical protein